LQGEKTVIKSFFSETTSSFFHTLTPKEDSCRIVHRLRCQLCFNIVDYAGKVLHVPDIFLSLILVWIPNNLLVSQPRRRLQAEPTGTVPIERRNSTSRNELIVLIGCRKMKHCEKLVTKAHLKGALNVSVYKLDCNTVQTHYI
jgi:hypothetical protein